MNKWGTKEWFESQFNSHELDTLGDKWGHRWRGSQKLRYKLSLEVIKEIVKNSRNLKILDIGCALGDFITKVYELNPKNEFYGMDISQKAIDYVQNKYKWLRAKKGALPDIPFPSNSFDLIIALEVLYYLNKRERKMALCEIKRTLKIGGYLFVSGPLGGRYFNEKEIIKLLSTFFTIKRVTFNYMKLYTFFERKMLKLLSLFDLMKYISIMNNEEFLIYLDNKSKAKTMLLRIFRSLLSFPLFGKKLRFLIEFIIRSLRWFLSLKCVPLIFYLVSRYLIPQKSKSHIIILCVKEKE